MTIIFGQGFINLSSMVVPGVIIGLIVLTTSMFLWKADELLLISKIIFSTITLFLGLSVLSIVYDYHRAAYFLEHKSEYLEVVTRDYKLNEMGNSGNGEPYYITEKDGRKGRVIHFETLGSTIEDVPTNLNEKANVKFERVNDDVKLRVVKKQYKSDIARRTFGEYHGLKEDMNILSYMATRIGEGDRVEKTEYTFFLKENGIKHESKMVR